jgi:hypothetical protein
MSIVLKDPKQIKKWNVSILNDSVEDAVVILARNSGGGQTLNYPLELSPA